MSEWDDHLIDREIERNPIGPDYDGKCDMSDELLVLPREALEELRDTLRNRQELEPEPTASNLARLVADRLDALLAAAKGVTDAGMWTLNMNRPVSWPMPYAPEMPDGEYRFLLVAADAAEEEEG